ncbi:MAG: TatD family hydrolase [Planctomycetes bacterium]|nr:TatD family hydrolase [Planctomycetota bacterium]
MIDIGANLADATFEGDRDAVLARAVAAGVTAILVTGTSLARSRAALDLARAHPGFLFATAGVHPHEARHCDAAAIDGLRALAREPEVVAVGECGLDHFRDLSPRDVQLAACESQLVLAADVGKPVFLHERDAADVMLPLLRRWRARLAGGVVHCFTGSREALHGYLDLDLHVGITGWICDERRGGSLRDLVREIRDDRLLVETDSPYLLPRSLLPRPATRRNEPCWLGEVCAVVARCRGTTREVIAATSAANARRLFRLPPCSAHQ